MAFKDCVQAVVKASGKKLTDREAEELLSRVDTLRRRVRADGDVIGAEERIARLAKDEANKAKIAAALARKHAAINVRIRERLTVAMGHLEKAGYDAEGALRVIMRGGNMRGTGVRNSVAATQAAFEARYLGGILGRIAGERPHVERMLQGQNVGLDRREADAFGERVVREIWASGEGQRNVTGDPDAAWLAGVLTDTLELSRGDINRLGGNIGKLEGYGYLPQAHDAYRLLKVSADAWVDAIAGRLDLAKTFPDLPDAEAREVLGEIYRTITTGIRKEPTAREEGKRVGPANLAKAMGHERTLHFKSADDWIAYNKQFGFINPMAAIFTHLRKSARIGGQMQILGPNPEIMLKSLAAEAARKLRDKPATKKTASTVARLTSIEEWADYKVMTGQLFPIGRSLTADAGATIRSIESVSKLGGVLLSSITDPVTLANNLRFQGKSFVRAYAETLIGYLKGRGKGDAREVSFLVGEGFDGLIDNMVHPYAADDAVAGKVSKAMGFFFRVSGLTWFTDTGRAVAARILAADMGRQATKAWSALGARYRNVLELHGITAEKWDVLRRGAWRAGNGNTYLTADRVRHISGDAFDGLIREGVERAREALKNDQAKTPETIAKREAELAVRVEKLREQARADLELDLHRFFADEVSYGIIEADARARAVSTLGTRPGTIAGEAIRFIMQFKSFPVAFTQRVLGRAVHSGPAFGTKGERIMRNSLHMGELIGTLWIAGMLAMWAKDLAKGRTPKELWGDDGLNWKVLMAGLVQSGGLGIYGDFLFAQNQRFGGSLLETLSGPAVNDTVTFFELALGLRDAIYAGGEGIDKVGDRAARWVEGLTPFANLFYIKAPLDYLILNSMREALSPGYLRRQEKRMKQDYGQGYYMPRTAF